MKYDFETILDRSNVGALKWESMKRIRADVERGIVPLSVADMEFCNAPEIIEGLKAYLDSTVLGYTGPTDSYFNSVMSWMERRHGFKAEREWIIQTPGVVPALNKLVCVYTQPGDSILVCSPVYYPFYSAIEQNGRHIVKSPLKCENMRYEIDFEDFALKAADPAVKMCIFCSPHNPIGRVWTRQELERVARICLDNGVLLLCDEIHHDLILKGNVFTSAGTLSQELLDNTIICTAPSKTFNLAGMQTSNIIIPSAALRGKISGAQGYFSLNALGYKACELAYNRAEQWLEQLLEVLDENRRFVENFMRDNLPQIKVYPLEGTYLQWWDMRGLGLPYREMEKFLTDKASFFLDEGSLFGEEGNGFVRINLACPKRVLEAALDRLKAAVASLPC